MEPGEGEHDWVVPQDNRNEAEFHQDGGGPIVEVTEALEMTEALVVEYQKGQINK